jgi:acetyl esterase/lipase
MPAWLVFVLLWTATAVVGAVDSERVDIRENVAFLAADRSEKLDVYLPPGWTSEDRRPAVVWIHGGGWVGGSKASRRETSVCSALARAGYVCVSVDYRLDGAWPQNLQDCRNGVRFLRAHADEFGIDPDRIAVAGGSAGGHLALMVAYTASEENTDSDSVYPGVSSAVSCVVDLYGITDLRNRRKIGADGVITHERRLGGPARVFGTSDIDSDSFGVVSPVEHVTANSPPTLILHGRADSTVDYGQSTGLAAVLERHGVPHQLVLIDGVGHTFDLHSWKGKPLPVDAESCVLKFLRRHLGEPRAAP